MRFRHQFFRFLSIVVVTTLCLSGCPSERRVVLHNASLFQIKFCNSWSIEHSSCVDVHPLGYVEIGDSQLTSKFILIFNDKAFFYRNAIYPEDGFWEEDEGEYKKLRLMLFFEDDGKIRSRVSLDAERGFVILPVNSRIMVP